MAAQLGSLRSLPVIDKDDFLADLLTDAAVNDPAERSRLSRLADGQFRLAVEDARQAVVTSFWRQPELSTTPGTSTDLLRSLGRLAEVHRVCDPKTAARRFIERSRHPGHDDAARTFDELCDQSANLSALGPLGFVPVFTVDTELSVDATALARQLDALRA